MTLTQLADLMPQIACIKSVDAERLTGIHHEVRTVGGDWIAEYSEYHSGGWWTTSLLNESGDPQDVLIRDCHPVATTLLRQMPQTERLLDELDLRFMWVRLGRLEPNSFLWEHCDYGELNHAARCRLHIPVLTNESSFLVMGGARINLRQGYIWRLNPTIHHGVCNLFGPDRIHLILDCYTDGSSEPFTSGLNLQESDFERLPELTSPKLKEHLLVARRLLGLGYQRTAESYLLRLFYYYFLPTGFVYDLIVELYQSAGLDGDAASWERKKRMVLGT